MEKYTFLAQGTRKALKMGTRTLPNIEKIGAWTRKCPFLCPQVPQDRLGSHRTRKWGRQACQMTSSSTKKAISVPKKAMVRGRRQRVQPIDIGYMFRLRGTASAKQSEAKQRKPNQIEKKQFKAKRSNAKQSKAKQSKVKQAKAKQSEAKQSKANQTKAEQSKAKKTRPSQAKPRQSNAKDKASQSQSQSRSQSQSQAKA